MLVAQLDGQISAIMVGYVHDGPHGRLGNVIRTDRLYAWHRRRLVRWWRTRLSRWGRATDGREKNHSIVEVLVVGILVAYVTSLYFAPLRSIDFIARTLDLNPDLGRRSTQYDGGTDLTIAQGTAASEVNEAIAAAIDQVERIIRLRENHLHLRATLLGIGAGRDQESNRERDGDKESTGGKLGCDCHSINLRYSGTVMVD